MERTMLTFDGRGTSTQVLLSMRALYSSHIAYLQLGSRRAWKEDLGIREEVVDGGGGGGEVFGGGVFGGNDVGKGVGGVVCGVACRVVCGVVKIPISMIRVPEKDRWCGARGKFVRWKGVRVTKESKRAKLVLLLESKNEVCLLCEGILKQIPAFNFICASLESISAIEDTWERVEGMGRHPSCNWVFRGGKEGFLGK
ncbi:hypothetical protein Tco_1504920 [Tanacetum coccineum]